MTYGLPFPKVGLAQHQRKIGIAILSQELVKLRTSNLAATFTGSIRQMAVKNLGEKGEWAYLGTALIFAVPLLTHEWEKLRSSNFVRTFIGSI